MLDHFKSLELTRHHVSTKFNKTMVEFAEKQASGTEQILAGVFSAALSLLFSVLLDAQFINISTRVTENADISLLATVLQMMLVVIIYIVIFIIFFFGFRFAYKRICKFYNERKIIALKYKPEEIKEIIDDFDIIAFDNLLVSFEFIKLMEEENKELVTFYFHELIYYLKTSVEKTQKVIASKDECINSNERVNKIDLFRIYNASGMMQHIISKAREVLGCTKKPSAFIMTYDERLHGILKLQIDDLEKRVNEIQCACKQILDTHYPPTR